MLEKMDMEKLAQAAWQVFKENWKYRSRGQLRQDEIPYSNNKIRQIYVDFHLPPELEMSEEEFIDRLLTPAAANLAQEIKGNARFGIMPLPKEGYSASWTEEDISIRIILSPNVILAIWNDEGNWIGVEYKTVGRIDILFEKGEENAV